MESKEANTENNKSDYHKVVRPASIVLKEQDTFVYPGTKRILNWKFSALEEAAINEKDQLNSYLNFNDFNYESSDEVSSSFVSTYVQVNKKCVQEEEKIFGKYL